VVLVELEIGGTKIRLDVASREAIAKELGGVARPQSTVFSRGKNVKSLRLVGCLQNKEQDARLQAYRRGRG